MLHDFLVGVVWLTVSCRAELDEAAAAERKRKKLQQRLA